MTKAARRDVMRRELARIAVLSLLLVAGIRAILHFTEDAALNSVSPQSFATNGEFFDSLRVSLEGSMLPSFEAHRAITGTYERIDLSGFSVLVPLSDKACVLSQVSALRQVQELQRVWGEDVPVHVVLASEHELRLARERILLLRKAVRPAFEFWYAGYAHPLSSAVLSKRVEPFLVVRGDTVLRVVHSGELGRLVQMNKGYRLDGSGPLPTLNTDRG